MKKFSKEFNSEVEVYYPIEILEMKYGYSKDDKCIKSGIKFNKVHAFRHKAEIYCTSKDIAAYDKRLLLLI